MFIIRTIPQLVHRTFQEVETRTGPVSCKVRNKSGKLVRRHFSQLFKQFPSESAVRGKGGKNEMAVPSTVLSLPEVESDLAVGQDHGRALEPGREEVIPEPIPAANQEEKQPDVQPLRRSTRVRKPVERLITTM